MDVADVLDGVSQAPVFVDPALPGASATSNRLSDHLASGDRIVLVLLSGDADVDATSLATRVSDHLDGEYVVGVAVGSDLAATAPFLPTGQAADLMDKAGDISNTPSDALFIFTTLVHRYQGTEAGQDVMETVTTTQTPSGTPVTETAETGLPVAGVLGALLLGTVIVAAVTAWLRPWRRTGSPAPVAYVSGRTYRSEDLRGAMDAWDEPARSLPPHAGHSLVSIGSDLDDVLDRWDQVQHTPEVAADVARIVLEYVPSLLNAYAELPADLRDHRRAGAKTPTEAVTERLDLIDRHLDQVRVAAYQGTLSELERHGHYLDVKLRAEDLDLSGLD